MSEPAIIQDRPLAADGPCVLVIDDEASIRNSLQLLLGAERYEVLLAENAAQGLAMIKSHHVDAIISDILMPGMKGTDFLSAVRRLAPDVEVLLMTGAPNTETAVEALRADAFDYLPKPLDPDRLLHVLGNAVLLGRARLENRKLNKRLHRRAVELERLVQERTAELARLSEELIQIQDRERSRVARELHDTIGQALLSLRLELQRLRDETTAEQPQIAARIERLIDYLAGTTENCRQLSHGMSPLGIAVVGLANAIRELCDGLSSTGGARIACKLEDTDDLFSEDAALHIYRIVQESLVNALRHSGAAALEVALHRKDNNVVLTIRDDGNGFAQSPSSGMGLAIMTKRAALVDGTLSFAALSPRGTEVRLVVPVKGVVS